MSRRRVGAAVAALLAGAAVTVLATPTAVAAAPLYAVTAPTVTPVLADYPYVPVVNGSVGDIGDAHDCVVTGSEERRTDGDGVYAALGCGGVRLHVVVAGDPAGAPHGLVGMTATTTAEYGCVHRRSGHTRVVLTRTSRGNGRFSIFDTPLVFGTPTALGSYLLLAPEAITCHRAEQPAHLSLRVDDLVVTVHAYPEGTGPDEVHAIPGSWTATMPVPPHPGASGD